LNKKAYGPAYPALLALSAFAALGAALTLVPNPGASWPNILGYKSICTFAPGATFGCALIAAIACVFRARLVRKWTAPGFIPIAAILLLIIGLAVSTGIWAAEKTKYENRTPETVTAASG